MIEDLTVRLAGLDQDGRDKIIVNLVAFGSLVAFSAYLYLLANTSPAIATSYAFVNPVIALGLGVALGGEVVSRSEWLACGVILSGVILIFFSKAKPV